ncbi:RHS repeat-associated protein [Chitinophaga terrae (ex Kim and Jung 2007)]|uniref:RHS repeat domain-containing protein n=1 Tax=Chitinophaga terrae (ex Kim and Jung 2007) TaxID=408074 RepID=UPI00278B8BEC|nr:RHS repeat-associated core domain-containing protein [Chitinophaga terrae (ex Kim and Jung 2007)]MDQ0110240.1 RHS repeat-associated protein [Chitinophaga terrae (ex Kim and Jung 2007)]
MLEAKTGILPASTSDTWSILNPLTDAYYQYYKHGPLARVIIGNNQVQGTDYAYTLSGWLKGINSHYLDPAMDMGGDGKTGLPTATIGKDVIGFALDYFKGDYKPIGTNAPAFPLYWQQAAGDNTANELYNGNISRSTLALTGLGNNLPVGYNYRYDQLNRLRTMRFRQLTAGTTAWGTTPESDFYKEDITYDANGNILSYLRNGNKSATPAMDQLQYQYNRDQAGRLTNNRLRHISDAVPAGNYQEDIDNQVADNYQYDNIGNLTRDVQGNISNIEWTVYGKIKKITKTDNSSLTYRYGASGNRIYKAYAHNNVVDKTWYVRDAQGNVLSVYTSTASSPDIHWKEQHLCGSSRLGIWQPGMKITGTPGAATALWNSEGLKRYELTNHLGNVMATISDKKINGLADVTSVSDYAPFGMQMVGRSLSAGGYRYGFNGKENDNEVKGEGSQQDYGMRIYDPMLGKFLSVDPLMKKYAYLSPYAYAENDVISSKDLDGLEKYRVTLRAYIPWEKVVLSVVNYSAGFTTLHNYAVHGDNRFVAAYDLKKLGYDGTLGNEGFRVQYQFDVDIDAEKGKEMSPILKEAGLTKVYSRWKWQDNYKEIWSGKTTDEYNKISANITQYRSEGDNSNFTVNVKVDSRFPYTDYPFWGFPSINVNMFLKFDKNKKTEAVRFSVESIVDGFPALEGFIERVDKPSEPINFLDWKPTAGWKGINLFPVLGDQRVENKDIPLPDNSNKSDSDKMKNGG